MHANHGENLSTPQRIVMEPKTRDKAKPQSAFVGVTNRA